MHFGTNRLFRAGCSNAKFGIGSNGRRLQDSHGDTVRCLIGRIAIIEMVPPVLRRALEPFPTPVRTWDAIHLAAVEFIRSQGASVQLASYDDRLVGAARLLGIPEWNEN
jgi:uncharacterized protein